jgi:hypothetical protein
MTQPPKWNRMGTNLSSIWLVLWVGENGSNKDNHKVNAWIMDCLDCHTCNFSRLHTNVKFKAIFKINIVNFLIIHVVIDFNGNHHNVFGWILKRLWICNGLLKWQQYVCHTEKNEKCGLQKICQSSVKIKINNKTSSNEEFIIEMHWNFPIYLLILKSFKWHDCYKFLSLKVHIT